MTPNPTARRETRDGRDSVVFTRIFRAPVAAVWAAITESDRLERWIGSWTGDPATGAVDFLMNAEGDDVRPELFTIHTCRPPHLLVISSRTEGEEAYELRLELLEDAGTTTLTFSQVMSDPELAASVGPGWEYYLDRLVAAETEGEVSAIEFDDYYPAQSDHFRRMFA